MIRFHLAKLLHERAEAEARVIPWKEVSEATGISVSVLSSLASPRVGSQHEVIVLAPAGYFEKFTRSRRGDGSLRWCLGKTAALAERWEYAICRGVRMASAGGGCRRR